MQQHKSPKWFPNVKPQDVATWIPNMVTKRKTAKSNNLIIIKEKVVE
jgi:hypothetical protein